MRISLRTRHAYNKHNQTTNQNTVSLRSRRTHADPVAEALPARGEDNRHLVEPKNRGERQTGLVGGIAMPHLWSASRRHVQRRVEGRSAGVERWRGEGRSGSREAAGMPYSKRWSAPPRRKQSKQVLAVRVPWRNAVTHG